MDLKKLFEGWANETKDDYVQKQWLLSKWEVLEGIEWSEEKVQIMIRSILDGLGLQKSDTLVDLGCGGGWILQALKPSVTRIVGLDFSQNMLSKAVALAPQNTFVCGAIGNLPFKENTFDRALSYFVFLNFMDDRFVEDSIRDVLRIVKSGGRVLIGQLPDKNLSSAYDEAKTKYVQYCGSAFEVGKSNRDIYRAPQKLFDKDKLVKFLTKEGVSYTFRNSFNPFYWQGQPETVQWRFDLILDKK